MSRCTAWARIGLGTVDGNRVACPCLPTITTLHVGLGLNVYVCCGLVVRCAAGWACSCWLLWWTVTRLQPEGWDLFAFWSLWLCPTIHLPFTVGELWARVQARGRARVQAVKHLTTRDNARLEEVSC